MDRLIATGSALGKSVNIALDVVGEIPIKDMYWVWGGLLPAWATYPA